MTTNIIIFAIVAIAIAVVSYNLGKTAESDAKAARCKEILNLPSPVDTLSRVHAIKIPEHYLARYVRMDKERLGDVNDAIKNFEDEGFTVDDYDTEEGIITMTKGIYEKKEGDAKVYVVLEVLGGQAVHIIGCFATQEEADAYIRRYSDRDCTVTSEEWKVGESVNP